MKKAATLDMTTGNPASLIIYFAIPMIIGNIFSQLYNMVDSIVVGRFVGDDALASVGTCMPIMFLLMSVFMGLSTASTILTAQHFGANDLDGVSKVADSVYGVFYICIVPITLLGVLFCEPMLHLIKVPPQLMEGALIYIRIILVGGVFLMGQNVNAGMLRGMGDSKTPLIFLVISSVINIVLDLWFVIGFEWGIPGVAVATVIAQAVSWILGVIYIRRKYKYLKLNPMKADMDIAKKILKIGIPVGIEGSLFSVGALALQTLVNTCGPTFIAGYIGAGKIEIFAYTPLQSIYNAIVTYTGQNVGARKKERIFEGIKVGFIYCLCTVFLIAGTMLLYGDNFMRLFTQDPMVIKAGMAYFYRILPFYLIMIVMDLLNHVMRGSGENFLPTVSGIVSMFLIRIPAAYMLSHFFGPDNMFFCYGIGWVAGALMTLAFFKFGKWRLKIANL